VFLSIVTRLLFLCIYRGDLTSDYLAYWNMSVDIYNGKGIREITYSTGYPMLLSSFFFIFGPHLLVVYAINILLSAATTLLVIAIAYEIFGSQSAAALSGIIWAVYAESVVYTTYVAKENLTIPLILLIIYFATLIANGKYLTTAAVLGGISTGLVAIAGTSGVCMVFSVLWAIFRIEQKIQKKMLLATLVVMTATAVVLPWAYRNYDVYGHFVINSNGGINLYVGNNPHADGFYVSMYDSVGKASWDQLRTSLNDYELDKYFGARAIAYIRDNPFSTATLFFKKIGLFWTPPYHQGTEGTGTGVGEMVLRKIWLIEWCLMVAGALYALKTWGIRGNRGIEAVVLGILVYTALHGVFFVIFRYRLPAMALVAVIAGGVYRYRLADEARGRKSEARAYPAAAAGNRN
jgi:4-amino-4-deoxy-L-arabinose transferase-like glycosyltransferase